MARTLQDSDKLKASSWRDSAHQGVVALSHRVWIHLRVGLMLSSRAAAATAGHTGVEHLSDMLIKAGSTWRQHYILDVMAAGLAAQLESLCRLVDAGQQKDARTPQPMNKPGNMAPCTLVPSLSYCSCPYPCLCSDFWLLRCACIILADPGQGFISCAFFPCVICCMRACADLVSNTNPASMCVHCVLMHFNVSPHNATSFKHSHITAGGSSSPLVQVIVGCVLASCSVSLAGAVVTFVVLPCAVWVKRRASVRNSTWHQPLLQCRTSDPM